MALTIAGVKEKAERILKISISWYWLWSSVFKPDVISGFGAEVCAVETASGQSVNRRMSVAEAACLSDDVTFID
jgi:hypothetical protein